MLEERLLSCLFANSGLLHTAPSARPGPLRVTPMRGLVRAHPGACIQYHKHGYISLAADRSITVVLDNVFPFII